MTAVRFSVRRVTLFFSENVVFLDMLVLGGLVTALLIYNAIEELRCKERMDQCDINNLTDSYEYTCKVLPEVRPRDLFPRSKFRLPLQR